MRKAYVLLYSNATGGRDAIRAWANSEPMIIHWRYDMPHSMYLISENSAAELAQSLGAFLKRKGRCLIAEVGDNRQGWLPRETWDLLRYKRRKRSKT
jgi:hypothetical protein